MNKSEGANKAPHGAKQATLDAALAAANRDAGIGRVAEAADRLDERWGARMLEAVRRCAEDLPEFIVDEAWLYASEADRAFGKPKAMGAVMLRAAREGWIERTDRIRLSARASSHRNPRGVWRSLIFGRAA